MKKISLTVVFVALLGASGWWLYKNVWLTQPDFANLVYSDTSPRNTLDIYVPKAGAQPYPFVMWFHGGGFMVGDKSEPKLLDEFLDAGIAVVSINYRLSGEAIWPAQLEDGKAAMAFVRANSETYRLNKNKAGVFGLSAGGNLSANLALHLAASPETAVQVAVDWFGPIDFSTMDADIEASGVARATGRNDAADSPESALIGAAVKDNPEKAKAASPLAALANLPATAVLPPFLIMHGDQDPYIGRKQSERLRDALLARPGSSVDYHIVEGGTHGGGTFQDAATGQIVIDFVTAQFSK
jgi:acetyl esterase/lipase